jgi:hypothetical protein
MIGFSSILATPADRFYSFQRYLNREGGGDPWSSLVFWLLILAAGTTMLILALRYAKFQRLDQSLGYPWRLFHRVLRRQRLSWVQRRHLAALARAACPETPLSPSALDKAARNWAHARQKDPDEHRVRQLAPIAEALFGQAAE